MTSHGKLFYLCKRNSTYYCRFKLTDGRLTPAKSTGKTSRGKAGRWAFNYMNSCKTATLYVYILDFPAM